MSNPSDTPPIDELSTQESLGRRAVGWIVAFHAVALSIATYPAIPKFFSEIPSNPDALQHLWIMRWYRTCLVEGRSPFLCPEIQFPIGAPMGNFSPLHFQSLLFIPLSFLIRSDVICYNLVWVSGLLLTGFGTTLLAWRLIGDRAVAAFAGLLAMLSAPLMIHASAHLELVWVGWFPIFLVWWMEFIDRPTRGRLLLAALGFLLVTASAAYYMVFAVFPATLYVVWSAARLGPRGAVSWTWKRSPWFLGLIGLTLPFILILFSGHIWTLTHGFSLERSREEFNVYGAPLWGFVTPTSSHLLGALIGRDLYSSLGPSTAERVPYLGIVCVVLVAFAAVSRSRMRRGSFVWLAFAMLAVLSLGARMEIRGRTFSLPASWLWDVFPPFRMTRVPSRFALFAAVPAAVLAAAGLKSLRDRMQGRASRSLAFALVSAVVVADLSMIGFAKSPAPAMPACYTFLQKRDPNASILEIPYAPGGTYLNSLCTYWQSIHRLNTSSGYSGHDNSLQEILIGQTSPFHSEGMAEADYLVDPTRFRVDLVQDVDFRDYVWLYLTANRFDYIVLHKGNGRSAGNASSLDRLKGLLAEAKIFEGEATVVYDRSLLKSPSRPVHLTRDGWGQRNQWLGRWNRKMPTTGSLVIYNPAPDEDLEMSLSLAAGLKTLRVRIFSDDAEIAHWDVEPGGFRDVTTPPFRLPEGVHRLRIESEPADETASKRPRNLRVAAVQLTPSADSAVREVARREPRPSGGGTRRRDTGYRAAPPRPPDDTARP